MGASGTRYDTVSFEKIVLAYIWIYFSGFSWCHRVVMAIQPLAVGVTTSYLGMGI